MKWRKFRQVICWILRGKDIGECFFAIRMEDTICGDCKYNLWKKEGAKK